MLANGVAVSGRLPVADRKARKHLSADALYELVKGSFGELPDHRQPTPTISLNDALLSAFSLFSLKDPSLLAFDTRRNDQNMKSLFGIGQIPSGTSGVRLWNLFSQLPVDGLRRRSVLVDAEHARRSRASSGEKNKNQSLTLCRPSLTLCRPRKLSARRT